MWKRGCVVLSWFYSEDGSWDRSADMMRRMKLPVKRLVLIAALIIAVVGYALLLWRGPWWIDGAHLRTRNLEPADGVVITGFRTALVALGAGALAGAGLYYTHRTVQHTRETLEHTREKDRDQAELAREGQVTGRYVEAIKLLSSGNLTQRLGGIYALERIMHDSQRDRSTIVEVLAAFIRTAAPTAGKAAEAEEGISREAKPVLEDVQAALTVIGRRPDSWTPVKPNLRRTGLQCVDLQRANLRGADLWDSDLRRADLWGAHLQGAHLHGANLRGADFWGAHLQGADLNGADLQGADFRDADLHGANLHGARLQRANLHGAGLRDADLQDANLTGAHLDRTRGLQAIQVARAVLDAKTKLPDDIAMDPLVKERIRECERASPE